MPASTPHGLDTTGLETFDDALATAIDQAGPDRSEPLLVQLQKL